MKQQATSNKQQATSNNNNNNFPLFSVIIPTYNRVHTILRTINSVLNQTYKNYEIIISDDGSTDNTKQIIQEKFSNYPNIKYIYHENQGHYHAKNYGATFANGEYLYFLDSDDECLPDFLMKMCEKYKSDPELGAVYCRSGMIENGKIKIVGCKIEGYIYKQVLKQLGLTSPSFITMKAECFRNLNKGWDENCGPSDDDDMCIRLAKNFKIGCINEALGIYHTENDDRMMKNKKLIADGYFKLINKHAEELIKFCNKKVLARHYAKNLILFSEVNDKDYIKQCKNKIRKYSNSYFEYVSIILRAKHPVFFGHIDNLKNLPSKIILEIKKFIKFKILRLK